MTETLVRFLLPVLFTGVLLAILIRLAPRLGLMDEPGRHKVHHANTPAVGGLAMFTGFLLSILFVDVPLAGYRALFAGMALLVIVGVLDDMHELSSRLRFVPQIVAALLMATLGGIVLHDLGRLLSDSVLSLGIWSLPLTVFSAVGVINALNMSDGIDGQSGSLALITLAALAFMATRGGRVEQLPVILVLGGVVATFLVFNLRGLIQPGRGVFMGDAGSMFLGFAICWFFVDFSQGAERAMRPVTALWLFALPLIDTVTVMIRRRLFGQSPTVADRTHYHHILLGFGLSVRTTLLVIVATAVVIALVAISSELADVREWWMFYAFCITFLIYFGASTIAVRRLSLHRHHEKAPPERGLK